MSIDLAHVVGSITTDEGPKPFSLDLQTGRFMVGEYVQPDEAQQALSITQQQRLAQLIHEHAGVSFAQVRIGQFYCTHCDLWVEATREQWSHSLCMSCSLDRASELAEHYAEQEAADEPFIEVALLPDQQLMLEKAIQLAVDAHQGQVDKAGVPYILHPLRMMLRMITPAEMMAAVLHDVVEDTPWTPEGLRDEGFSDDVLEAVSCLTRRDDETYQAFIERAAPNMLARRVKLADLEDNMDLRRLTTITEKDQARLQRYQKAWKYLMEYDG